MAMRGHRSTGLSRRDAIGWLGSAAGLALIASCRGDAGQGTGDAETPDPVASELSFPDGAIIRAVLSDIDPRTLSTGATLFHEHVGGLYTSPPLPMRDPTAEEPSHPGEQDSEIIDLVVHELEAAAKDGLGCIVDAAVNRRDAQQRENLEAIATRSPMPIVIAGGYYQDLALLPYPPEISERSEAELADELSNDARTQRWGAFGEIASSEEMQPDEQKVFRAVGTAHLRTGLPIFTHTPHHGCVPCGFAQLDVLESQGVDPRHVCIGHLTDIKPDQDAGWQTHKAIAERGAFLGFDTVGHPLGLAYTPDIPEAQKVEMVLSILDAGYEDQLLLSADFYNAKELKANWGNGFSTVLVQFVPKLRHAGVTEETLHKILVDNPRRFLAFVPKQA